VGWVKADATSAIHGTLKLGKVVGAGKRLLSTSNAKATHVPSVCNSDDETRATERRLLHDRGVAELLDQSLAALDSRIRNLSSLVRSETRPGTTLHAVNDSKHAVGISEVDEGIADIATRLEVDTEVQKVVSTEADVVEDVLERHPVKLVRNVAKHDCSADIATVEDTLTTNTVVLIVRVRSLVRATIRPSIRKLNVNSSRAVAKEPTECVDARLEPMRGCHGTLTSPGSRLKGAPVEGVLCEC